MSGRVIVVTGPPGAGKSTVAPLVADRLTPSVHFHTDDYWNYLRNGAIAPHLPEAGHQNRTVITAMARSASALAEGGYQVVVDGILGPWFLDLFRAELRGVPLHYAVLLPAEATAVARAAARDGDALSDPEVVADLHRQFARTAEHPIDTTGLTPEETCEAVLAVGPLPDPGLRERIEAASLITGEFVLRSGRTATEYFDKYLFESDPVLLDDIARALAPLVPEGTEVLAGLELGGIPVVTALSRHTGLPAAFVRKKAKEYGTRLLAEGAAVEHRKVLVVEDVVTSGGQIVLSTADLRALGADVTHALCVVDRGRDGRANLAAADITLVSLLTTS